MTHGVIGVFREKNGLTSRCSVSVRKNQTRREFETQIKSEHKNVNIYLDKFFIFECQNNIDDVEKSLRKILIQSFGLYESYNGWENYTVENYEEFIEFIENLFNITKIIINVTEVKL